MNSKRSKFAIALFATLSVVASSATRACDDCKPNCTKCKSAVVCDDKGLLSIIDTFAGRIQSGVRASLPQVNLPKLGSSCNCKSSPKSSCDGGPSCGCESGRVSAGEFHRPAPTRLTPSCAPPMQPHVRSEPVELPSGPMPLPREPESVPVPESSVDPFMDDSVSRVRKLPARTILYTKPSNRYRESYDPQAFNSYRVRLNDESPSVQSKGIDGSAFKAAESSRRSAAAPSADGPEVVTASAHLEPAPVPIGSKNAQRLPSRDAVETYYANPLRADK
jgi:hypothetical protein